MERTVDMQKVLIAVGGIVATIMISLLSWLCVNMVSMTSSMAVLKVEMTNLNGKVATLETSLANDRLTTAASIGTRYAATDAANDRNMLNQSITSLSDRLAAANDRITTLLEFKARTEALLTKP